jgi:hypothetical protein
VRVLLLETSTRSMASLWRASLRQPGASKSALSFLSSVVVDANFKGALCMEVLCCPKSEIKDGERR